MGMLYNLKFFQLKLHFKVSFTLSKNDIVRFSTGNELFIKADNGVRAQPRNYNISIKIPCATLIAKIKNIQHKRYQLSQRSFC